MCTKSSSTYCSLHGSGESSVPEDSQPVTKQSPFYCLLVLFQFLPEQSICETVIKASSRLHCLQISFPCRPSFLKPRTLYLTVGRSGCLQTLSLSIYLNFSLFITLTLIKTSHFGLTCASSANIEPCLSSIYNCIRSVDHMYVRKPDPHSFKEAFKHHRQSFRHHPYQINSSGKSIRGYIRRTSLNSRRATSLESKWTRYHHGRGYANLSGMFGHIHCTIIIRKI